MRLFQRIKDESHTLKSDSETLYAVSRMKTDILSMRLCYTVFFALKRLAKAFI